jgi:deoxyribonuclease-1
MEIRSKMPGIAALKQRIFMKKLALRLGILISLTGISLGIAHAAATGNQTNESFDRAKKVLLTTVYPDHLTEFYCDNGFTTDKKVKRDPSKYTPKKNSSRAKAIEWEHIVPAEAFGQSFVEWRKGHEKCRKNGGQAYKGRECAEKVNKEYRLMQADMYNLVPAIGELNGLRSNYTYAMIPGEPREFGVCDFEVQDQKAEPRPQIRGDIARTYLYMHSVYPGRGIISNKNEKLYQAWDKEDPIDQWECTRAKRIEAIQKNSNEILLKACQAKGWW